VAGRITAWSQIAGSPLTDPITPVGFDLTSAARSVFLNAFVDLSTPLAYQPRTFTATAQVRDYIASTRTAWGYLDLNFARSLHSVPYEGVPSTRATIVNGTYPARRKLGFVTRGRPRGALARFISWVRHDRTARRVISSRYVPV
jgi:phosphate transport system substrate-binding protein